MCTDVNIFVSGRSVNLKGNVKIQEVDTKFAYFYREIDSGEKS